MCVILVGVRTKFMHEIEGLFATESVQASLNAKNVLSVNASNI